VCIGTIEPRKNHIALIEALRSMHAKRPQVVMIGRRGWECDAIVAQLLAAQADGLLHWIEDADDDATFSWMRKASVLAYPSAWEGFGFPPLEAMAMGLPVVANDCEPMRELTDGNALLCNAHDATALADALLRALADRQLRDRLQRGGIARASTFRWEDCAAAHAAVYREAAQ
jgi:glycosyltransferase involved in cell wall biosynthesis